MPTAAKSAINTRLVEGGNGLEGFADSRYTPSRSRRTAWK